MHYYNQEGKVTQHLGILKEDTELRSLPQSQML